MDLASESLRQGARTWILRLQSGGISSITELSNGAPVAIGRGLGCRLILDDERVSRLQCEVWVDGAGVPWVRNHGKANPTAVNGAVVEGEVALQAGDEISFAGYRLVVELAVAGGDSESAEQAQAPTTRMFSETPFHPNTPVRAAGARSLAGDLLGLLALSRRLAEAGTLERLLAVVREHLRERVKAEEVWLAWPVRGAQDVVLYPPVAAQAEEGAQARLARLAREVVALGKGVLRREGEAVLVAAPLVEGREGAGIDLGDSRAGTSPSIPLRGGTEVDVLPGEGHPRGVPLQGEGMHRRDADATMGRVVGVICARGARGWGEEALDYLLAVAEVMAPHVMAVERREQYERDAAREEGLHRAHTLLGRSAAMRTLREELQVAAENRANVLLLGESGTGKELAARLIHDLSTRAQGPYVAVNCAALPAELFESEMFGHEKGAFTGAGQRRKGLFEEAHGGTLFLDEMGDLSPASQARLLRAADSGLIRRVGGASEMRVDVRLVSATNRELPDATGKHFRSDLYHRLAGFVIHLPALRARCEDIPELAAFFLRQVAPHTRARPITFSTEAMAELTTYDWPGNVRELRNVVERACYLAQAEVIDRVGPLEMAPKPSMAGAASREVVNLDELEAQHLRHVLEANAGDVAAAASALGIPRSTLYYKLSKFKISLGKRRGE